MQWQYKWLWIDSDPNASIFAREESTLNTYGNEGWELVTVVPASNNQVAAVMKKPK
jgi:hypothetical protein